ncbi:MAG TPA: hypoxanthine phosphoribosyltransferase [Candidatus Aquilonibacter sp.]|nr:hypoxanthine phosphoribosyltransferase [Candidatus Aquilonibacter sp.]
MIGDLLFDAGAIDARVREIGAQISRDYAGRVPVLVGVLNAAAPFLADLTRAVSIPCEYDVIAVTKFSDVEGIRFEKDTSASVEGRHVILVEDTIDTGMTLQYVAKTLRARQPASLEVCTLLDRPARRIADIEIKYRGFEIPDVYVVGYGLDYLGRYRELQALYAHGAWP